MDDSQESWREDLDTRNDMGQEFSNEETDVRGEIMTPRERATYLLMKGNFRIKLRKPTTAVKRRTNAKIPFLSFTRH